jgi:hypothetical protein
LIPESYRTRQARVEGSGLQWRVLSAAQTPKAGSGFAAGIGCFALAPQKSQRRVNAPAVPRLARLSNRSPNIGPDPV